MPHFNSVVYIMELCNSCLSCIFMAVSFFKSCVTTVSKFNSFYTRIKKYNKMQTGSLVKYHTPILVSLSQSKSKGNKKNAAG